MKKRKTMKEVTLDLLVYLVLVIIVGAISWIALNVGTSPSWWYAGDHDYNRLVKQTESNGK